ncbi:FAD linked oxidase domain protein [Paenibacillus sp. NAIST15-1]|nr:FAD linked oxidase domain protein [Paenibacillus sp. NAIST15-1]
MEMGEQARLCHCAMAAAPIMPSVLAMGSFVSDRVGAAAAYTHEGAEYLMGADLKWNTCLSYWC